MAMECFKRNIHVISEKPAGVYTKQVREMNEASKSTSALFGMMFNQRTNCLYRKMREMIAAGEIGELQRVTWIITDWFRTKCYYDSGSWRATWDGEGGGVLINQSPHQLDLIQWIVGELPVAVNGFCKYGKWHDVEVEDEVTAYLQYKNGATGVFITTTGELPGTNRLEISGTGGKLLCEGGKLWVQKNPEDMTVIRDTSEKMSAKSGELVEVETDGENPQQLGIINNFAAAILGKEPLFVNGCDGIAGVELMNAIELSGWKNGATVTLPVDEEEYLAQLNAHRATSRTKVVDDSKVSDTSDTFGVGVKK
jgi:predicted dehydrogenase